MHFIYIRSLNVSILKHGSRVAIKYVVNAAFLAALRAYMEGKKMAHSQIAERSKERMRRHAVRQTVQAQTHRMSVDIGIERDYAGSLAGEPAG